MGSFFAELRRRHIYRVGAAYVVVAWGITQVIDVLSQIWALPAWIAQPVTIVLALGLPVTLIVAWLIEGKASEAMASAIRSPATATDWVLASALIAVLGFLGYQQFSPRNSEIALTTEQESAAATIADEIVEAVSNRLPNSVAVLPFENQSLDPENAFFASGVHDEIINQLSKLRNLNVIARTSVMDYPESGKSIPEIADELNVEMIMGGSVRYAGDEVRVTAKLFDGATNVPVWTDAYDGDLSDIFAIQADIAMNIANSLQAEFSVEEQESIERPPTDSPEAYEAYLKAIAVVGANLGGGGSPVERRLAQSYLDQALELDPEFALAHAWKAAIYLSSRTEDPVATEENWLIHASEMDRLALSYADMALALDPGMGFAHTVLGWLHLDNGRVGLALEETELALRLSPNDPMVLIQNGFFDLAIRDRPDEAIKHAERVIELDPNNLQVYNSLGIWLHIIGRNDAAIEVLQECLTLNPSDGGCSRALAAAEFARGNNEAALDALRLAELSGGFGTTVYISHGYGLLRQPEDAQRIFEIIRVRAADRYVDPVIWAWAYMGVGDYDEALNQLNTAAENPELIQDNGRSFYIAVNIWSDPMLDTPAFVEVRNRLALTQ